MPANATTPAATPAAMARIRKYCSRSRRPRRSPSASRYAAARYAHTTTASTPPRIDVGLVQLPSGSPPPLVGTRPEAIPPATVPRKNGVITDDTANATPNIRCCDKVSETLPNANPARRPTIPTAASANGMYSVSMIAANAPGNAVQRTTRQKINHTWLASHTGPRAWSISARGRRPRRAPPAVRSQKPAPKSAPPSTAYRATPRNKIVPHRSLIGVHPCGLRCRVVVEDPSGTVRDVDVGGPGGVGATPPSRHAAQHEE